jgi:hypothetical protein
MFVCKVAGLLSVLTTLETPRADEGRLFETNLDFPKTVGLSASRPPITSKRVATGE